MILSRRIRTFPRLGVRLEDHNVYHSQFRVGVEIREGVGRDWALWPERLRRGQHSRRSSAVIALTDGLGVRSQGMEKLLHAGECFLDLRKNCWGVREVGRAASLVLEWEPGAFGSQIGSTFETIRLSGRELSALRSAARSIAMPTATLFQVRRATSLIFGVLSSHGIPLRPSQPEDFMEAVPRQEVVLTQLIDRAFSQRGKQLGMVDLEALSGFSERSLRRYMGVHLAKYHFNSRVWRDLSRRWRLSTGLALMGSPKATTEEVSELLGYSSPTAFCRAFAASGLPSPGSIRQLL